MKLSFLNELPLIEVWDDVFTEDIASKTIALASSRLAPSSVVDFNTRQSIASNDGYRTSYDAHFYPQDFLNNPEIFYPIIEKIEKITGYSRIYFEPPTIIRYDKNQSYQKHTDLYPDELHNSNKRVATVIMYLNDVEGGSTEFNNLGIKVFPKTGRLLYFNYDSNNSAILDSTTHTGNPPDDGYKWVVTVWIKNSPTVSA